MEATSYGKPAMNLQSMPMAYHQSSGILGTSPGAPHVPHAAKQNLPPPGWKVLAAGIRVATFSAFPTAWVCQLLM